MIIKVKLDEGAIMPKYAHGPDAGADLFSCEDAVIPAGGSHVFDTGVHMAIEPGYYGKIESKSGLNVKHGLTSTGVIDAGYTGSIRVKLYNHSPVPYVVRKGDKISQILIQPVVHAAFVEVESLEETDRGDGGFGSTGR